MPVLLLLSSASKSTLSYPSSITYVNIWFQGTAFAGLIFVSLGADFDSDLVSRLTAASDGLSLATNVLATALIGYVYW